MISKVLETLEVGTPVQRGALAVYPLLAGAAAPEPFYLTLDEALAAGGFRVTEVSSSGSVPELLAINELDRPVLILHGEQLVGAKQNRIVNLTVLVPAETKLTIPVSCVEQGRWHAARPDCGSSPHALHYAARAHAAREVSACMARHEAPRADQGALWERVNEKLRDLHVASETGAVEDAFAARARELGEMKAEIVPAATQTGAIFAIAGHAAGLELFDSPRTLARMLPKIVSSYALDAIDRGTGPNGDGNGSTDASVQRLLGRLRAVTASSVQGVGLGTAVRLAGQGLSGGGLVVNGRLVHLAAFRLPAEQAGPSFRPPHMRRGFGIIE